MKKLLLCVAALLCAATAATSQNNYSSVQNFIEVTGVSEVSLTPDIFYVSITIDESDSKGRYTAANQQKMMIKEFEKLDINVAKSLKLNSLTSTFEKRTEAYSAINYTLQLNSKQSLVDVFAVLDELYISKVYLERTECSQLAEAKATASKAAIQDAKAAAEGVAEAIGQSIGSCFYIYDMSNDYSAVNYVARSSNFMLTKSASADSASGSVPSPLELKEIEFTYRVKAKFFLEE